MCDYSLAELSNRLARAGEHLVLHRFPTGSLGLKSSRRRLREILFPSSVCAVCIPPGARLLLQDIPEPVQCRYLAGSTEAVTFVQLSLEVYTHRDGVRFTNGREVLLQELEPGQRVTVLSLGDGETAAGLEPASASAGSPAPSRAK